MGSKLVRFITLLLASTLLTFILINLSPIDPIKEYTMGNPSISAEQREKIAERWGMNDSPAARYWKWLRLILSGNWGESIVYRQPVLRVIMARMKNTLLLMTVSWVSSGVLGYFLGALMGAFENSWWDRILKKVFLALSSVPTYWLGLLLLMIFSVMLKWFPIGFSSPIGVVATEVTWGQRLYHLILPALTLCLVSMSSLVLYTRQNVIEVFHSDYVLFAYARGLSKWQVFKKHGIKNTLGSGLILQFSSFAELFGGSILAENIFSYPGLGTAITTAGLKSDVPLILGITLFSVLFVFVGNFIADILHRKIDPRIKRGMIYG